jgi:RHS repeat-associated protein
MLTALNPIGGLSSNSYDGAGNLTSHQDPDTGATTYGYDTLHRPILITRPGGATASFTYDARDRLLTATDERGRVRTFGYDTNNRPTTFTDPDTNTATYVYDELDRVQQVTDRLGETSSVTYDARRLLSSVTDFNGNATSFAYDARQRPVTTTDPGGKTWTRAYDEEGLLVAMQNPVDAPSRLRRNSLGQVIDASNALGHTTTMTRDSMQRVVQTFDPLGRATSYTYDRRGLLASATEQGTGTAKYQRDAFGSVTKIIDPNGAAWAFTYTKAGRPSGMSDPLGRPSSQTYDLRGRRAVTTFADGTTETRTYDAASNLTRRQFTDGTDLTFAYDNLNRITATNELALSYDAEGRITNSAQASQSFGATYDAGGRLLTATSPSNGAAFTVTYGYDTRDRLVSVGDNLSGATVGFAYDDAGRLTSMTRSNGADCTRTYDGAGRLTRIQDGPLDLKYGLDASGEVTSVDYTAPLLPAVSAATAPLGFDKASQIASSGFTYDARGRLTTAPTGVFAWDGASRLTTAAGVALTYNGLGDVATRTVSGTTTRFFHNYAINLHPIVAEKTESAAFVRFYVWSPQGRLLYAIEAGTNQPVFYHFDRIGSTLALTDHTGATGDTYVYGPYGEPLGRSGTSTQPFTYVGAYGVRAEGALHQMRARYYDPATARFISRDPIWPSLTKPKRLNPYEYAAQSPGEFIDPTGLLEYDFDGNRVYRKLKEWPSYWGDYLSRSERTGFIYGIISLEEYSDHLGAIADEKHLSDLRGLHMFSATDESRRLTELQNQIEGNRSGNDFGQFAAERMFILKTDGGTLVETADGWVRYFDTGRHGIHAAADVFFPNAGFPEPPPFKDLFTEGYPDYDSDRKPEGEGSGSGPKFLRDALEPARPTKPPPEPTILDEIEEVIVIS